MPKLIQAKHISDKEIVSAVVSASSAGHPGRMAIQSCLPTFPIKVVNAKLRAASLKGLLAGCVKDGCTCSDAYFIEPKGDELWRS